MNECKRGTLWGEPARWEGGKEKVMGGQIGLKYIICMYENTIMKHTLKIQRRGGG
jgi:hypothetical protein